MPMPTLSSGARSYVAGVAMILMVTACASSDKVDASRTDASNALKNSESAIAQASSAERIAQSALREAEETRREVAELREALRALDEKMERMLQQALEK